MIGDVTNLARWYEKCFVPSQAIPVFCHFTEAEELYFAVERTARLKYRPLQNIDKIDIFKGRVTVDH